MWRSARAYHEPLVSACCAHVRSAVGPVQGRPRHPRACAALHGPREAVGDAGQCTKCAGDQFRRHGHMCGPGRRGVRTWRVTLLADCTGSRVASYQVMRCAGHLGWPRHSLTRGSVCFATWSSQIPLRGRRGERGSRGSRQKTQRRRDRSHARTRPRCLSAPGQCRVVAHSRGQGAGAQSRQPHQHRRRHRRLRQRRQRPRAQPRSHRPENCFGSYSTPKNRARHSHVPRPSPPSRTRRRRAARRRDPR